MSWELAPTFDAAFRATISSKKNLIYVCPPSWWTTLPLYAELPETSGPGIRSIFLIPEALGLRECATQLDAVEQFKPVHAATGLTRAGRLLRSGEISTLVSTPADLLTLLSRSDLDTGALERVFICWPEMHEGYPDLAKFDAILSECKEAQRIVLTSEPKANADFLERHARRAPTATCIDPVAEAAGSARYVATDRIRVPETLNAALDVLNPATALVWDPERESRKNTSLPYQAGVVYSSDPNECQVELAIALDLPMADVLQALLSNARNVLILVRAFQIPYLRAMLSTARTLRLPSESDRAHDKASRLRKQIRDDIEQRSMTDSYLALTSLFDEHDPATVAAALASRLALPDDSELSQTPVVAWVRIRVEAGKRNRIRTGDLVGAMLNAIELPKNKVGRVDVRDGYSLIEVRAEVADKAVKGLNGLILRGNKLAARLDRH